MPVYSVNKKAKFDFELLETFEAGLILNGIEVKSIRSGQASLKGAFVTFHNEAAFITNFHIPKYKFSGKVENYEPERSRKLLLNRKEISYLRGKSQEKGLTIVPISLYTKGRHIKVELAVARGKKKYDKREAIKKKDLKRELSHKIKEG
ncbi:MAG: SsrA-binding protein [Candidatus Magasanikbacteria bacterium RIFCSPHIGHO2_01_FULL_33_34]|uniref:SsrA-binding protein n=1 Tax=Candidatus Magasanikbacteria bacterium RIFCSPHIGHO2_01_FULL_33_34 TaxID=1798671 RepID=A0A1F6LJF2_9BACT|nr:MAG: SsrA-binding protein [Candidatus Magasanikbacteria bacterium RIFCSPHIGHO2_01_FULL_33_34]OGH65464.1 MAG: SsrA-binding protein [Candidatus Magasanikbacteria bacterium RIFCSPHIGHO2_02_FULL_33_17]OGH76174.1 MAG: SsrA-binding protein [Candidatus Magasanikbacteria bacterium RIFCSPLOWO2_01_FULL_33_34]OGH81012.1 MAG: SsrA-binding protein [Candidatus Magasanikbacteria bacterium RIFCSPLOWO2_12_FULL_34_7]